jgi:alpha-tubulin suppressor-like RCC1 family protein
MEGIITPLQALPRFIRAFITAVLAMLVSAVSPISLPRVAAQPARELHEIDSSVVAPGPQSLTSGDAYTCALTSAGGARCWGVNFNGQLGDGTAEDRLTPVDVSGLSSGVSAISADNFHTCVVTASGGAKCWGDNSNGELGDGTTSPRLAPTNVSGLTSGVRAISGGLTHTCALTTAGGVKCWGANDGGQLGDGTTTQRLTPVDVSGLTAGVAAIATGNNMSCALTSAGGVKCWGTNDFGQLGDGTTARRLTPVDVSGLTSGAAAIANVNQTACALTTAGGMKCWGFNFNGEVGDGTTIARSTPVDVSGLTSGVAAIAAGFQHTCALTTAGGMKCWGLNIDGQLGDGTRIARPTPVDVLGLSAGVAAIAPGYDHSCALTSAGGVKCWGLNEHGQVGDGTTTGRLTPVDVSGSFYRPECPTLIAAPHTSFTLADGYAIGSTASFFADPGFMLDGSATLTCLTDSTWSGSVPTARPEKPTMVPGQGRVVEGDSGSQVLQIPVMLTEPSSVTVTAAWTTIFGPGVEPPAPAEPGSDFEAASGTVTFEPGATETRVSITVLGDALEEPDEWIVVAFGNSTNAVMGGYWGLGFGVIEDDDAPPRIVPGAASVVEGDSGWQVLQIPVMLTEPSSVTVTAEWTTIFGPGVEPPAPAEPGTDFEAASGTVTFEPGATATTIAITVLGDLIEEPDEWVVVAFGNPTNAIMGGFWGLGFGVIEDDDAPPRLVPASPSSPGTVVEADSGSQVLHIPVALSDPSTASVTAEWRTIAIDTQEPPVATEGTDYLPASGVVTFDPGVTEAVIPITVLGDTGDEPDESVVVQFSNLTNAIFGPSLLDHFGFGLIVDND